MSDETKEVVAWLREGGGSGTKKVADLIEQLALSLESCQRVNAELVREQGRNIERYQQAERERDELRDAALHVFKECGGSDDMLPTPTTIADVCRLVKHGIEDFWRSHQGTQELADYYKREYDGIRKRIAEAVTTETCVDCDGCVILITAVLPAEYGNKRVAVVALKDTE